LAVDEIATNIITYGYEPAGIEGDITVRADTDEQALTIIIEDNAKPFDPLQQMEPDDLDLPLEQRNIGGLGIYLAINGVDKFTYGTDIRVSYAPEPRARNSLIQGVGCLPPVV